MRWRNELVATNIFECECRYTLARVAFNCGGGDFAPRSGGAGAILGGMQYTNWRFWLSEAVTFVLFLFAMGSFYALAVVISALNGGL